MFSVEQKRGISQAVQDLLRATNHPELPTTGEISFTLHVDGAKEWSWADIKNNGAVGDPGVNPHNEAMASMPESEARELIDAAIPEAQEPSFHGATPYMPDPRNTPDEFMTEMLKQQIGTLTKRIYKAEAIIIDYNKRINEAELVVTAHEKRLTPLESALSADSGTADSDVNPLVSPMEQLRRVVTKIHQLEERDKINRKLYSEVRFGLDTVQEFLTPIIEDNLIAHHDDQINNLNTAIRQLGNPQINKTLGGG